MIDNRISPTKPIQVFVPALPNTPGWSAMNQKDREWLQEHTSNAVDNFRQSGFKAIQSCAEIALIEQFLEGKPMTMTNWMATCFGASERTGWRWLKSYKEMRGAASDDAILYLAEQGISGLNSIQRGDIVSVIKRLPPPKDSDKKHLEEWRNSVGVELRKGRSGRRKSMRRLDPDEAMKTSITFRARLLREAKIGESAAQRAWLKKELGYLMEMRAVTGTVSAERVPIPDGFMPRRGRPRKRGKAT